MPTNMSNADRFIRTVIAILMLVLYFSGIITGVLGILLIILSIVFVLTSLVSVCPLYALFGISTCKVKAEK